MEQRQVKQETINHNSINLKIKYRDLPTPWGRAPSYNHPV